MHSISIQNEPSSSDRQTFARRKASATAATLSFPLFEIALVFVRVDHVA
jgi:hypothetical protein